MTTKNEGALSDSLPQRTMPVVHKDGTFRNPWSSFHDPQFSQVAKWKMCNNNAPKFPSKKEAAAKLPSVTEPDWELIRRYDRRDVPLSTPLWWSGASSARQDAMHPDCVGGRISVTWCSHSAFLVQVGGLNVLTDPVWSAYASPVQFAGPKRMVPVPIKLKDLPQIDLVTISHNHYDHLDYAAVLELRARFNPLFVVPLGMKRWFDRKFDHERIVELNWWEEVTLGLADAVRHAADVDASGVQRRLLIVLSPPHAMPAAPVDALQPQPAITTADGTLHVVLRVTATPVQHWSMRTGFDRYFELWCGFAMRATFPVFRGEANTPPEVVTRTVFHCGDSGYCTAFAEVGAHLASTGSATLPAGSSMPYAIDVALLPIGAYEPRNIMTPQHVNPAEAVRIHDDMQVKYSVGMHWGTFILTDEPIDQPPKDLHAALQQRDAARTASGAPLSAFEQRRRHREFVAMKHGESVVFDSHDLD